MDILEHLTHEHRTAEGLLDQLARSEPGPEREDTLAELEAALTTHLAVEEQYLYPIVQEVIGDEDAEEAEVEHDLAREGLRKLRELVDAPGFGAAVDMVTAGIAHHVTEEEQEMFPELRQRAAGRLAELDPEQLEAQVRASDTTKDELYRRAQEAGVPGRSTMSKAELASALGEA